MNHIPLFRDCPPSDAFPCVLALGFFDGVHLAHRALLSAAKKIADESSLPLCVFTFRSEDPTIKPGSPRIYPTEQKLILLEELGVHTVFSADFREFSSFRAQDFVRQILIGRLHAKTTVCGFNFRFGSCAEGDAPLLGDIMTEYGLRHVTLPPFLYDNRPLSSTEIRESLAHGDLPTANRLLGRPYFQCGRVMHGDGRGHRLGFPTVNLPSEVFPLLPAGVYATRTRIDGRLFRSVTNVGACPTFGVRPRHSETFLIDFDNTIYSENVIVEFLSYLRTERTFMTADELKKQIIVDISMSKKENCKWQELGQNFPSDV